MCLTFGQIIWRIYIRISIYEVLNCARKKFQKFFILFFHVFNSYQQGYENKFVYLDTNYKDNEKDEKT